MHLRTRLRPHRLVTVAVVALVLAGCGTATDDDSAPSDPPPSVSEVSPTTAEDTAAGPDAAATSAATGPEDDTGSTNVPGGTGDMVGGGAGSTGGGQGSSTGAPSASDPAAPSPTGAATSAAGGPGASGCDADQVSSDLFGFPGGVSVTVCQDGWAAGVNQSAPGEPEFIAELVDGRWLLAVTLGDPVCQGDLIARGAPEAIAALLSPCAESTAAPTSVAPTDPGGDCLISTVLYGQTRAELVGVDCAEARAEWQVAEANAEPSWTESIRTPGGWECYVTPYDPTSTAAGSCYGPAGSAYFTLYLP